MPTTPPSPASESTAPRSNLGGLLNTRFATLARNTIDYWMLPDDATVSESEIVQAIETAPFPESGTLQIYIHVPFCAQRCRFCAFSGGNSLEFDEAERFARLLITQMEDLIARGRLQDKWIRAINIGGGSPDLLGSHIATVLKAVRDLPGCDDRTEIAVEMTLSTTSEEFVDNLVQYGITKASFGIQSLDPTVRKHLRQPPSTHHLDRVLDWIGNRIPVVNADLITGLPGQDLAMALKDLHTVMDDPRITGVSSYVLTSGAAPALVAALSAEAIPPLPSPEVQARMRLMTYAAFARAGWERRGTNTYYPPNLPDDVREKLTGNECIGTHRYEDLLIGVGPQAISCLPGVRLENRVDIEGWCRSLEQGEHPYHLPKCSTEHQRDIALWAFPLRWEGLPRKVYEQASNDGAFSKEQIATLREYVNEGLILETSAGFELSILGEVFMGHLVRGLKSRKGRLAVDEYIEEGDALGKAIASGKVADQNQANNRQLAAELLLEREGGKR